MRGAWIEIGIVCLRGFVCFTSHPVRGAWIEMSPAPKWTVMKRSHPVRGAWIEISPRWQIKNQDWSHPVRGAWIEMYLLYCGCVVFKVAPREGCVD